MTEPTRDMHLPHGCIGPGSLRALADSLERLAEYHVSIGGSVQDRPCLRRIEAQGDRVVAYVSTGRAVGGSWFVYSLGPEGWKLEDDEGA